MNFIPHSSQPRTVNTPTPPLSSSPSSHPLLFAFHYRTYSWISESVYFTPQPTIVLPQPFGCVTFPALHCVFYTQKDKKGSVMLAIWRLMYSFISYHKELKQHVKCLRRWRLIPEVLLSVAEPFLWPPLWQQVKRGFPYRDSEKHWIMISQIIKYHLLLCDLSKLVSHTRSALQNISVESALNSCCGENGHNTKISPVENAFMTSSAIITTLK